MRVHKQSIPVDDQWHTIKGGKILHVQSQQSPMSVEVWFENEPLQERSVRVFGTGHLLPDSVRHLGSTLAGTLVWHLYETYS